MANISNGNKITDEQIKSLEGAGFKRWTKGGFDRLYINADKIGLDVDYYKTGNICYATWKGEKISNARAGEMIYRTKVFIDVTTGEIVASGIWQDKLSEAAYEHAEKAIKSVK